MLLALWLWRLASIFLGAGAGFSSARGGARRRATAGHGAIWHVLLCCCWLPCWLLCGMWHGCGSWLSKSNADTPTSHALQVGARDGRRLELQQVPQAHRRVAVLAEPRKEGHARGAVQAPNGERQHGRDANPAAHGNQHGAGEGRGGAGGAAERQLVGLVAGCLSRHATRSKESKHRVSE